MYEWGEIDLSPRTLAMAYNDGPENYITNIEPRTWCADDDIISYSGSDPIGSDLEGIVNYEWEFVEQIRDAESHTKYRSLTYKYGDDVLIAVDAEYDDLPEDAQILCFITEDYFVIVEVVGRHPYIETPYLIYDNSDGSGPDILYNKDGHLFNNPNPKTIAKNLVKYYKSFMNNEYH